MGIPATAPVQAKTTEIPLMEKEIETSPPLATYHHNLYDIEKLAKAIAMQETQMGENKKSVGYSKNNVCGITKNGKFKYYNTKEEALEDCKRVITQFYSNSTIYQMSRKYTATQQDEWFNNVTYFYNK